MSKPTFLGPLLGKGVGQCELVYAERGTVLAGQVEPAFDSKARKRGLLGRESIPDGYAMIIAPCSAVHTFSMRVPLDVMFVTRNGTIMKVYRGLKPGRIAGSLKAFAVIEAAEGFIEKHEIVPGEVVALREIPGAVPVAALHEASAAPAAAGSHPAAVGPASPTPRHTTRKRVTLADIIACKTPLEWFESVAIVQELCEAVLARGPADDLRVPELKHIALTADGRVLLLGDGPGGHSPVQRTGLVILALTPEDQLPMQLRLLVLEEVSPRPRLQSLNELHRELEFFERPDRPSIVRDVHERFQRQISTAAAESAVPPPLLEPPLPKRHYHWRRRRGVRVGALIVVMTLAGAALVWIWPRPEGQWLRSNAARLGKASVDTGKWALQVVRHEVSAAKWNLGFRPSQPERSVLVLAQAESPRSPEAGQNITLEAGTPPPQVPPFQLARPPLTGVPDQGAAVPVPGSESSVAPSGPGQDLIFSAADQRVVPPRLLSPAVSATPPNGANVPPVPEVELLVAANGEVESVKLVSGATTAVSGMRLSALKAWRFEPATRDGRPVRYRLRIPLNPQ